MKRLSLVIFLLCAGLLPMMAQQMSVEEFARLKGCKVEKDKTQAILDLLTEESGFTFAAGGNQEVQPQQGQGYIRLALPHKTVHLRITHPVYGTLSWMAPEGRKLKRNRHYQAVLVAGDPTREYKSPKQWVAFHLDPPDMLLQVDSVIRPVRQGVMEYYLSAGRHSYHAEAPFFAPQDGSFTLTDSTRTDITVKLQPFYSFLTVRTEWQGGDLYIDGARIRKEEATSYRLGEGYHRVSYYWASRCYYDTLIFMGPAQKQVLELKMKQLSPKLTRLTDPLALVQPGAPGQAPGATVKLIAADSTANIWVDRERVAAHEWEGRLSAGFHIAQTVSGGKESAPTKIWVEDGIPQEVTLLAPGSASGLLNVHCNVTGASILVDGRYCGETPLLVRVDASKPCQVDLVKDGYRTASRQVRPRGNNQVDVYMQLKKR